MLTKYKLGTEILFGVSGNATQFQGNGWRSPENNHTWSVGNKALLRLFMPISVELFLKIKLSAFVFNNLLPAQRITLQINNVTCAQWTITSLSPQIKIIPIPAHILKGNELTITFITPDATSPSSLGINADQDCLGVCLTSVNIFTQKDINATNLETRTATFSNMSEFQDFLAKEQANTEYYATYEAFLLDSHQHQDQWDLEGYCEICRIETHFQIKTSPSFPSNIRFRENVYCPHCGLKNRQRHLVSILLFFMTSKSVNPTIYIYEQTSKLFSYLKTKLTDSEIIGSEYLSNSLLSGTEINGIRHEDALSLSFKDNAFDIIIAADVYEHVPDITLALHEAYRVLNEGGILLFTVPFHYSHYTTQQRAAITENGIMHYLPELYHDNPISPQGSLVFYDFGWDLLDICKQQGFNQVVARHDYGIRAGYLGTNPHFIFIATK